jgi:hydrogenase maturation protease
VIRRLPPSLAGPDVQLCDYGIRGVHLAYDLLDGWDSLVLIDALPDRGRPGALHVFEADHESVSNASGLDAHAMDPAAVFGGVRALGGSPPYTIIVGCEVATVADGIGLSEPVAAAVPGAVTAVAAAVARLSAPVREG